jgi:hypothetical protein
MAYDKNALIILGNSVVDAGVAFGDGFQLAEDSDEILAVVTSIVGSAGSFKEDTVAALLHLAGRITDLAGDIRRAQAQPPVV